MSDSPVLDVNAIERDVARTTIERVTLYAWYVSVILALAQIMSSLDRYLMSVVLEPVKHDLKITDSQLGLLSGSSFAIVFCIASIPLGRLVDAGNRRLIVAGGIFFWSMSTLACAFASSFQSLFLARMGIGLGEAALLPAGVSLIAGYFNKTNMTKGLAVFTTGNALGRAAAFLGGGAVFGTLVVHGGLKLPGLGLFRPWQGVFLIAGLIGVAVSLLCLTIVEPRRVAVVKGARGFAESWSYFRGHFGVYARLFILYGLLVAAASALATWTISLYVRDYGWTVGKASAILGGTSLVAGPLATLIGGWLTDRLLRRNVTAAPILIGAWLLGLSSAFGVLFWFCSSALFATVIYVIVYFLNTAGSAPCLVAVQLVTPGRYRGVITSLYLITYMLIGIGVGPLIVGLFNDYLFHSAGAIAQSLTLTLVALGVLGVPFVLSRRDAFEAACADARDSEDSISV